MLKIEIKEVETVEELIAHLKTVDPKRSVLNSFGETLKVADYGDDLYYDSGLVFEPQEDYDPTQAALD